MKDIDAFEWLIILCFCFAIGMIIWIIYDEATAEKFEIRKDKFSCTQSHDELVSSGKILTHERVCDQYTRKNK